MRRVTSVANFDGLAQLSIISFSVFCQSSKKKKRERNSGRRMIRNKLYLLCTTCDRRSRPSIKKFAGSFPIYYYRRTIFIDSRGWLIVKKKKKKERSRNIRGIEFSRGFIGASSSLTCLQFPPLILASSSSSEIPRGLESVGARPWDPDTRD